MRNCSLAFRLWGWVPRSIACAFLNQIILFINNFFLPPHPEFSLRVNVLFLESPLALPLHFAFLLLLVLESAFYFVR